MEIPGTQGPMHARQVLYQLSHIPFTTTPSWKCFYQTKREKLMICPSCITVNLLLLLRTFNYVKRQSHEQRLIINHIFNGFILQWWASFRMGGYCDLRLTTHEQIEHTADKFRKCFIKLRGFLYKNNGKLRHMSSTNQKNKNLEILGIEPRASCMQSKHSTNWAISPAQSTPLTKL